MRRRWLLLLPLILLVAISGPLPVRAAFAGPPAVYLAGERRVEHPFLPVYQQGDWLDIYLTGVSPETGESVRLSFWRWGQAGWEPADELPASEPGVRRYVAGGTMAAGLRLIGSAGNPLPVGFYQAEVRAMLRGVETRLAAPAFAVIFNAPDIMADSAYLPQDWDLLSPFLPVVTVGPYGPVVSNWGLDIYHPWVFNWALQVAAGSSDPAIAAGRLARAAAAVVDGFWPALPGIDGAVPDAAPPAVTHPWKDPVMSVAAWLASSDWRGQCYDYTAVTVALLRAVGLPSRAVTVTNPLPMPHPYNAKQEVQWEYHVWAEVQEDDGWLALDPSYMEALSGADGYDPGPQPRTGGWFTAMVGPSSQVFRPYRFGVDNVTADYLSLPGGG